LAGAQFQVARVTRARGIARSRVETLVIANERGRLFGFIGEPRVNVLRLNLALDELR
jgi:K+-transporting ATPase ATPase C chain